MGLFMVEYTEIQRVFSAAINSIRLNSAQKLRECQHMHSVQLSFRINKQQCIN